MGGKTKINADFDFFETGGGNSLQAAQIVWGLEKRLGMEEGALNLEMLFRHPKFGDFVEAIWRLKFANGENENGRKENWNLVNMEQQRNNQQPNGIEAMANFEFKRKQRQKLSENEKNFRQNVDSNIEESDEGMATKWIGQNHPNVPQMHLSLSNSLLLPLFLQLKPSNGSIRLHIFCIHPISGSAFLYRHLAQTFPKWANVVGIQFAQGLPEIDNASNLRELAKIYAEKVQ